MTREMNQAALILLKDNAVLRKMAATWPQVKSAYDIEMDRQSVYAEWAVVSGLHVVVIQTRADVLFKNGICHEDGSTTQQALQYIAALAVNDIRARKKGGDGERSQKPR